MLLYRGTYCIYLLVSQSHCQHVLDGIKHGGHIELPTAKTLLVDSILQLLERVGVSLVKGKGEGERGGREGREGGEGGREGREGGEGGREGREGGEGGRGGREGREGRVGGEEERGGREEGGRGGREGRERGG